MKSPERLISTLFYGQLNELEQRQLSQWLRADPNHADLFMREALVHQHFMDQGKARSSVQAITSISMICTDRPQALLQYLQKNGWHDETKTLNQN